MKRTLFRISLAALVPVLLLSGCREGKIVIAVRDLPPEERRIYAEVKPYIKRINRHPRDVAAYLQAARILKKAGYTSYARRLVETGLLYSPQSLELLLEKARIEEAAGIYAEALKDYEKVLESAADDVAALRGAARSAFREGKRGDAAAYLARARKLSPSDPGLMLDEAEFAYLDGDLKKALSLSMDASKLAPHLSGPYYNQGLALLQLGKLDEALDAAQKALTLSPKAAEIHALAAEIQYALGDDEAALGEAKKALEISSYFDQPYRTLAKLALKSGDVEVAISNFKSAVKLNPSDLYSLLKLRQIAGVLDDGELALYSLRRLSRLDSRDLALRRELAATAFRQEQFSEAAAEYRILAEQNPADAAVWKGLGDTYAAISDREGVVEAYSRLEALGKAGIEERIALATAYLESGSDAKAGSYIGTLLWELPADDPRLARLIGYKLCREGRAEEAIGYLTIAAEAGDEAAAFRAAVITASLERYEEAASLLEDMCLKGPYRADMTRLLAELRERAGDIEAAYKICKSVLALNPDDAYANEFMARYYYERDDVAGARAAVDRVLAVAPQSIRSLEIKGHLLEAAENYEGALASFTKACNLEPSRKELLEAVARIRKRVPETRSLEDMRAAFRRNPRDFSLLWQIAEAEAEEEPARAVRTLRLLIRNPDTRHRALERTADLYFRMDRQDKAVSVARRIASLYPDDPSSHTYLAGVLAQEALYKEAIAAVKKAVEICPEYIPALRLAGRIHLARDEPEDALASYLILKKMDPTDADTLLNLCRIYTYRMKDFPRARAVFGDLARLGINASNFEKVMGNLEKAIDELEAPLPPVPLPGSVPQPPAPKAVEPPVLPEEAAAVPGPDAPALTEEAAAAIGPDASGLTEEAAAAIGPDFP